MCVCFFQLFGLEDCGSSWTAIAPKIRKSLGSHSSFFKPFRPFGIRKNPRSWGLRITRVANDLLTGDGFSKFGSIPRLGKTTTNTACSEKCPDEQAFENNANPPWVIDLANNCLK